MNCLILRPEELVRCATRIKSEWYVSFHGGDEAAALNNIHVFSADGAHLRKALNKESLPAGVTLRSCADLRSGRMVTSM